MEGHFEKIYSNESFIFYVSVFIIIYFEVSSNKIIFVKISEKLFVDPTSSCLQVGRDLAGDLFHFTDRETKA